MPPTCRRRRQFLVATVAALVVTSCATGERPRFDDEVEASPLVSTGNAEIDTVLGLLNSVDRAEFTAGYTIDTKFNSVASTGLVVQAPGQRRSVTVDNDSRTIRFIVDGADERTCDLVVAECEARINNARISDTQLSHTFYGDAFARRLATDAGRRIGDPALYSETIAGENAQCVDVVVNGGTKTYCALATGPLARFVGADVTIEMTSYSPEPDETKFSSN